MDVQRWERIQEFFHRALSIPVDEREAYLGGIGDAALAAEVRVLIEADRDGSSPLDQGLAPYASGVFDGSVPLLRAIGRYRVLRVIGQGGMGVVYLGEHEDLSHRVAIKVLRDAQFSPVRRSRFEREQRTLARLNHPSIARLYGAELLPDGTPYFVMEYVPGVPLDRYCHERSLSLWERLAIFRSICTAVQHAHRHAIVHRDLKPSNIMVVDGTEAGERRGPVVKLLDFGIAKSLEDADVDRLHTRTGLRLMTAPYAAPEQLTGDAVGLYTDVYALGVVLYELLTGRLPYEPKGLTQGQLEDRILGGEPERPSVLIDRSGGMGPTVRLRVRGGQLRGDLDALCLTAMHREPQRRYGTVEALIRDLDHLLDDEPLEARPDTVGYRVRKLVRRNRRALAVAGSMVATLVATAGFYTEQLREQRNRARTEAVKAQQVSEYLIGLFEASDPFREEEVVEVSTLLEQGVKRAERLEEQPEVQAQMLDVLGRVYTRLTRQETAEALLRRALTLRLDRGTLLDVAETSANLGRLYSEMGRRDSAEVHLRRALAIRRSNLPADHADIVSTLNDLGSLLTETGEYEEAEELYRTALGLQRSGTPTETLANTLSNLGVNYFNRGQHLAAEPYYREALEVDRSLYGDAHPNVATRMANLAMVLEGRGELTAADSMLSEALGVLRRSLGEEHYLTAYYGIQLGVLLRKSGERERAEEVLRTAVATHESVLGPDHPNTAVALNQLALALGDLQRFSDAEPFLRRAAGIFDADLGPDHYYSASSRTQLAHVLHRSGRPDEAESLFRAGLPPLERALPADHQTLLLTRIRFGALLVTQGLLEEAEELLLPSYSTLTDRSGLEHPLTTEAAVALATLYQAWGRPADAARYQVRVAGSE